VVERLVAGADIRIDGDRPWDVRVHDDRLYNRVLASGTLGLGEAYMDGWWDCDAIDQMVAKAQSGGVVNRLGGPLALLHNAGAKVKNLQTRTRSTEVGRVHYDVGNDLYERMLDSRMIYSCGYWRTAEDLDSAQVAKLELIANKLQLEPGMRVLDIGCGWGGASAYFAETRGCDMVGVTISEQQALYAKDRCAALSVEIRTQDYRDVDEPFDRIYSIGMFEHVGVKNYKDYMTVCRRCLSDPDGLTLIHTIGGTRSRYAIDAWFAKYIFPNSMLPSAAQITAAAEQVLELQDWQNFGIDYERTLMNWHSNVESAWADLPEYDERFRRMWRYYLLSSAGSFRAGRLQLWQIVFSREALAEAYRPDGIR
jgi:cyclopropane-fatty-acyl-phospholipid synthase